jgi:hypothetical protein
LGKQVASYKENWSSEPYVHGSKEMYLQWNTFSFPIIVISLSGVGGLDRGMMEGWLGD